MRNLATIIRKPLAKGCSIYPHCNVYALHMWNIINGEYYLSTFLKLLFQDDVTYREYSLAKLYSQCSREVRNLGLFATQAQVSLLHFAIEMMYK